MDNYQQINIEVSPCLIPGKLISKNICRCEADCFEKHVTLGREYNCDLKSVRWAKWTCYECGRVTEVRLIDVYSDMPFVPIQWMLLDLLDIGAGIKVARKPDAWEVVQHNKVSPRTTPNVRRF